MSTKAIGARLGPWMVVSALVLLGVSGGSAQTATQQFNLRASWNAIWLEIEPARAEIGAVFTNVPLSSVWTYVPNDSTVQFIRDQNEAAFNDPVWLRYFPSGRPEAFVNNLFSVRAGRAYLVKLSAPATLTVTGRPVIKQANWLANSFNLRGFPIDPAQAPSFANFFAPSSAHAGQPIYRLGADGKWSLVDPAATMASGEAYWAYSRGASTYQAPLGLELDLGDGLDFGVGLTELGPRLRKLENSAKSVSVRDLITSASSPLSYSKFENTGPSWVNLPNPHVVSLGARASSTGLASLRLAIRRRDLPIASTTYSSILEIKDNAGTRYLVPVNAARLLAARPSQASGGDVNAPGDRVVGVWMGTASITKVNEPNSDTNPTTPQPTRSPFTLRLLLHVTDQGEPRLLKEVLQMWQESTRTNGVVDKPGRYVLLTDGSRIPNFSGAALRGGRSVGRRISTADYAFSSGSSNYLAMSGTFGPGQQASCTLVLGPNFPTNPFRHKYHPDHDNNNASFQPLPAGLPPEQQEVYEITRALTLTFSATDPEGPNGLSAIEYGDSVIGGTYRERITGLHKAALEVEGTFRLRRVNNSPVLNQ